MDLTDLPEPQPILNQADLLTMSDAELKKAMLSSINRRNECDQKLEAVMLKLIDPIDTTTHEKLRDMDSMMLGLNAIILMESRAPIVKTIQAIYIEIVRRRFKDHTPTSPTKESPNA